MDDADGLAPARRRWAMLTIVITSTFAVLDSAIANVALPSIAHDLGADPASAIWVVNAYQLALVILILPLASSGDLFGYRRIYCIGLVLFVLASLACTLSHSLPMLTLARGLQGIGGAALTAVNTALVRFIYPRAMLGRGIGVVALTVATSSALGPTVAAAILAVGPWQWLFAINLPFGIIALALALRTLPENRRSHHRYDFLSAGLSALTFGLVITGIDGLGHGERLGYVLPQLAAGGLIGAVFVWRQLAVPFPMLPVDLFRRPVFALSAATSLCSFIAQGLALVSLPFYFEDRLGLSQVQTGLLLTPWPATVAVMAPIAGRLSDRYSAGILGATGLAIFALGLALLAWLPAEPSTLDIIWRMTICGLGFGFFQTPNNRAIISSAPRERAGSVNGIVSTARLFGQTIGAALAAMIFGLAAARPGGPDYATTIVVLIGAGFAASGALASALRLMDFRRDAEAGDG